jgi:hypothetical protein
MHREDGNHTKKNIDGKKKRGKSKGFSTKEHQEKRE